MAAHEVPLGPVDGPVSIQKHSTFRDPVIIPRATALDRNLSLAARGLLIYMLSLPANYQKEGQRLTAPGPEDINSLVEELQANGYLDAHPDGWSVHDLPVWRAV